MLRFCPLVLGALLPSWRVCSAAFLLASLAATHPLAARELDSELTQAIERAGENGPQIQRALDQVPEDQREGMEYLVRYMPEPDLKTLDADFLLENVDYAYRAWRESPWHAEVPQEIFLNDLLPYANINERRDRWRKDFYERFRPWIADAKSASEAAAILNQKLFPAVNVRYSTKRPKADQSPYESIDAGLASCTGLSILLIDACRAVGIPARFVGIPLWTDRSGNHSWVEVWDRGWQFTGAAEPTGDELNKAWFVDRASQARADEPRHAIYAVSYRHTPTRFPLVWDRRIDYVRAVNVTQRYAGKTDPVPVDASLVMFRVLVPGSRDRCAANFRVRDKSGNIVFQGQTKDERFDANDHISVPLPKNEQFQVEVLHGDDEVTSTTIETGGDQQLVTLEAAVAAAATSVVAESDDAKPSTDAKPTTGSGEPQEAASVSEPNDAEPSDDGPSSTGSNDQAKVSLGEQADESPSTVAQLRAYLQTDPGDRTPLEEQPWATQPLDRATADQAQSLLWDDYAKRIRAAEKEAWEARVLEWNDLKMPFAYKQFGTKPESGHSLYISMHGGGNAPARVNDRQWENQKGLYEPEEGIYLAPRAPTNTWNLWHEAHIDHLFDRLITAAILFEDVDPNRVYLMGYSAGGDGVYQLAPRFADRLAAAAMMAGHPNEAQPLGLRNLPFTLHMGGDDAAYRRNEVAREWGDKLASLQAEDPQGYEHWVKIHEGKGHWMQREDAAAVPWMAKYSRNPLPEKIVWWQDDVTHPRFYWLAVPADAISAGTLVKAQRDGQSIQLQSDNVRQLIVRLNDEMIDLDAPIRIEWNGQPVEMPKVARTIEVIAKTIAERGDPAAIFSAEVELAK